ncbi:uncharacterized protein [Watersipora subatra]|uniref:uncharacterized protein n=1 Tax=Watersipora subatra TaxID=2589382 RepID=UPI00355B4D52
MYLLLVFSVVTQFTLETSSATPIHSSSGVPACTDSLRGWLTEQETSPVYLTCSGVISDLEEILAGCRPSDPVYMIALLQAINNQHYRQLNCALPANNARDCTGAMACFAPIFTKDITVALACEESQERVKEDALSCFVDQRPYCDVADIMRYTVLFSNSSVCSGPACVTGTGVFQTQAGSECQKWQWIFSTNARKYTFDAAAGTIFSADDCAPVLQGSAPCYN